MTTIAEKLTLLAANKTAIAQALQAKGVDMEGVPFDDFASKISSVDSSGEWVRPSDWLDLPEIAPNEQKFVGLYAIYPDLRYVAFKVAGDFTVDWGDGNVENYSANTLASHEYNYNTYDVNNDTLCTRGYKQAIIVITPQNTNTLSAIDLHQTHINFTTKHNSGFLDIALASDDLTSLIICVQTPDSSVRNIWFNDLERINIIRSKILTMRSLLRDAVKLREVSVSVEPGVLTSTENMFFNCVSLTTAPLFDTSGVTTTVNMFSGCAMLVNVPTYNTENVADMTNMFSACSHLTTVPAFQVANVTAFTNSFANCYNLKSLLIVGAVKTINLTNCSLSSESIDVLFNNLGNVTITTTIDLTSNYGLQNAHTNLATAKGWTVMNQLPPV